MGFVLPHKEHKDETIKFVFPYSTEDTFIISDK